MGNDGVRTISVPKSVQLHVVEELLEAFQSEEEEDFVIPVPDSSLEETTLMTISLHACNRIVSNHSLRVKGLV